VCVETAVVALITIFGGSAGFLSEFFGELKNELYLLYYVYRSCTLQHSHREANFYYIVVQFI
jgi:hypothetical protein